MEHLIQPKNTSLPFLTYGSFKPGELRYSLIKEFIDHYEEVSITGQMFEKDGVPFFNLETDTYFYKASYQAFILHIKESSKETVYNIIGENEPKSFYEWGILDGCNLLIGNRKIKGSKEFLDDSWSFQNDPYFEYGLEACELINVTQGSENHILPFFTTSSAYLLLWTIIERFCALKYGNLSPNQRLQKLSQDEDVQWSKIDFDQSSRSIYRSDEVGKRITINSQSTAYKRLQYYYGIRSNMVHRGKDVFRDIEIIENAYNEVKLIFEHILKSHGYKLSNNSASQKKRS
tara:strand:- start:272 stop:1138 length:867 start_codon:yes stop_codon:yes gene_type:complete